MTLPYHEPLVPREPGERVIPEPPRPGRTGRGAVRDMRGQDHRCRLVRRHLDAACSRRWQPAWRCLAGQPGTL